MSDRATKLSEAFAANVLAACAEALDSTPDAVLEAVKASGARTGELGALRSAWHDLAFKVFPLSTNPPRKLGMLVRGQSGPRPLWQDLADLEAGLGVSAADLLADLDGGSV